MSRLLVVLLAVAIAALAGCDDGGAAERSAVAKVCDRVASPGRSGKVVRMARRLEPGQTGCLRGGVYRGPVTLSVHGRPGKRIKLRSYPGQTARLLGRVWITRQSSYLVLRGLHLDGRNRGGLPSPTVNGRYVDFVGLDVTNEHTAICFDLGHPRYGQARDVTIRGSRIHNCGRLPPTNHDHGIYVGEARDTRIVGNRIYDNADAGIQLFPDARRTYVARNVIDANGEGILIGGSEDAAPRDNVIERNVITNSRTRYNVESYFVPGGPIGSNNLVRGNCIQGGARDDDGSGGIAGNYGFEATGNITEAGPTCVAVLRGPS